MPHNGAADSGIFFGASAAGVFFIGAAAAGSGSLGSLRSRGSLLSILRELQTLVAQFCMDSRHSKSRGLLPPALPQRG